MTAALIDEVIAIARRAADEILAVYGSDLRVRSKTDGSAVTDADEHASRLIASALVALAPSHPVVCEEAGDSRTCAANRFWLIDPLDGTREFINGNGEFTVNIALVETGEPVLGVVAAPALRRLFAGARGHGAFVEEGGARRHLSCRRPPAEGLTVVSSRSHGDEQAMRAFLKDRCIARHVTAGSSLKFCMVAAGEADLYPRLGATMEWDTAAGHAIVAAAGGTVTCMDGKPLLYGKPGLRNPHFMAAGL